jgi:hypothetical protein
MAAPVPQPLRREHKIRGLSEFMGWFESSGEEMLKEPPILQRLILGDLFIHITGLSVQMWIWDDQRWEEVVEGHAHPYLSEHRLRLLNNGEPRWVTRKTVSTYGGRKRNHNVSTSIVTQVF